LGGFLLGLVHTEEEPDEGKGDNVHGQKLWAKDA